MATHDPKWAAVRKEIVIYYPHNAWQALIWGKTQRYLMDQAESFQWKAPETVFSKSFQSHTVPAQGFRVQLSIACKTNRLQPPQLKDNKIW